MAGLTVDPDDYDRLAKLLVDAGEVESFALAEELLRTYRLQLLVGADASAHAAWQAAVLTAVNAGGRAMHGGVVVVLEADEESLCRGHEGHSFAAVLSSQGATFAEEVEDGLPTLVFGTARTPLPGTGPVLRVIAGRWVAGVLPERRSDAAPACEDASVIAAIGAAGLGIAECFQYLRGFAVAGDRTVGISLWDLERPWDDDTADGPPITSLPRDLWMLGLGHLGQAYAWLLSLLPYSADAQPSIVLQDDDRLSMANRGTSMFATDAQLGQTKARLVAAGMERAGWRTAVVERRYRGAELRGPGDPNLLLAGVDNREARAALDGSGFSEICDAGLGAGPDGYLDMAIRRLPGSRPSAEIWPPRHTAGGAGLIDLPAYQQLEIASGDRCGVEQLAGRTVATAFVGVVAAVLMIGGILREIHGGPSYELVDLSLRQPAARKVVPAARARRPRVPLLAAAGG